MLCFLVSNTFPKYLSKAETEESCNVFSNLLYVGKKREIEGAEEEHVKEKRDVELDIGREGIIKPRQ